MHCSGFRKISSFICKREELQSEELSIDRPGIRGFLKKKGYTRYNIRYCVLEGKNLKYYVRRDSKEPKGIILLPCANLLPEETETSLTIRIKTTGRVHQFKAQTQDEKNKWRIAIQAALDTEYGTVDPNNYLIEGYIKKFGTKIWNTRWCKIEGEGNLLYFADVDAKEPKGKIHLPTARLHQEQSTSGSEVEFQLETNDRKHYFQARNKAQKEQWMASIRAVGQFKPKTEVEIIRGENAGKVGTIQDGENRTDSFGNYGVDIRQDDGKIVGFWVLPGHLQART